MALKNRLIMLGWLPETTEVTGEYDQTLREAIEQLQLWLRDHWDEAAWGDVSKMPSVNGEYVDWKTMNVIYSDVPPMKPEEEIVG